MSASKNRRLLLWLLTLTFFMFALAYASVPLYRLFCEWTGFGGTPRIAAESPQAAAQAMQVTVRFNTDVAPDLLWQFQPEVRQMKVNVGEVAFAKFFVKNVGKEAVVGTSTYNVTPEKAAVYFNKLQCFCFTRHLLQPGEAAEFPMQFFLSSEWADDPALRGVKEVTLSYSFFKAADQSLDKGLNSANLP